MLPLHPSPCWGLKSWSVEVLWRSLGILKALNILSKETHKAWKTEGHTCFNAGRECKEVVSHRATLFFAKTQFRNSITLLPSCLRHSEDSTAPPLPSGPERLALAHAKGQLFLTSTCQALPTQRWRRWSRILSNWCTKLARESSTKPNALNACCSVFHLLRSLRSLCPRHAVPCCACLIKHSTQPDPSQFSKRGVLDQTVRLSGFTLQ